MKKYFSLISHTHWDREWYLPFDIFRYKLIDLIDKLIEIVEKNPKYVFHLDAQTIILDDYFEVRKNNKQIVKKMIKNGNIIIGPWYLQNDFYLTSGESTVRNLIFGINSANKWGKCSRVGYAPDQFGSIGQLPQILKNFKIDSYIFGRGFSKYIKNDAEVLERVKLPTEFKWTGSDGTSLLAFHLKLWYNNAQRLLPNLAQTKTMLDNNHMVFKETNISPFVLMMNGVDHLQPQDDVLEIINNLNDSNLDIEINQISLDEHINKVKNYISSTNSNLQEVKGELNLGSDYEILRGCLTSRIYLKKDNVLAQDLLESVLEPIYSMLLANGFSGIYDDEIFEELWISLMKNHPHDNICGCSCDLANRSMEVSYDKIFEKLNYLTKKALNIISSHSKKTDASDFVLTIANTLDFKISQMIKCKLEFPSLENVKNFKLMDNNNREVSFCILKKYKSLKDFFSPLNLPKVVDTDVFEIECFIDGMDATTIRNINVLVTDISKMPETHLEDIQNEFYSLNFENGKINLFIKDKQKTILNLIKWEYTTDIGDSYVYVPYSADKIFSDNNEGSYELIENFNTHKKIKITNSLKLPSSFDFENNKLSNEIIEFKIESFLTLKKNSPILEFEYNIINNIKDTRIRLVVDSEILDSRAVSDSAFEIIDNCGSDNERFFGANYAVLNNSIDGMAIFTKGLHEFEKDGTNLIVTILRATGGIFRNSAHKINGGEVWEIPENQCQRKISNEIGICFYSGDFFEKEIERKSKEFRIGLTSNFISANENNCFGKSVVQRTEMTQRFFEKDKFENNIVLENSPIIEIKEKQISRTILKKSFRNDDLIARYVNLSDKKIICEIICDFEIFESNMYEEKFTKINSLKKTVFNPKEIKTFIIKGEKNDRKRKASNGIIK